jgi:20S proteasome subunit alpha 7
LSSSTYSPDGRIFQVEYANKAVENSGTAIGIRAKDGIVLAVEKLIPSKLLVKGSNVRIQTVDTHVGITSAGLVADARHLVNRARKEANEYRDTYKKPISARMLCERTSQYVQAYTLYGSVRPFGVSAIIGCLDEDGSPRLMMIEPSGVYYVFVLVNT